MCTENSPGTSHTFTPQASRRPYHRQVLLTFCRAGETSSPLRPQPRQASSIVRPETLHICITFIYMFLILSLYSTCLGFVIPVTHNDHVRLARKPLGCPSQGNWGRELAPQEVSETHLCVQGTTFPSWCCAETPSSFEILTHVQFVIPPQEKKNVLNFKGGNKYTVWLDPSSKHPSCILWRRCDLWPFETQAFPTWDKHGTISQQLPWYLQPQESPPYLESPGFGAQFYLEATLGTARWTPGQMHSLESQ